MKLSYFATILLSAASTHASAEGGRQNTVTFVSLDHINRTMYFASNPDSQPMKPSTVPGGQNVTVVFPHAWQGNGFAVADGHPVIPGMLVEFAFNGWSDLLFFDVSAIVNASDTNGVKQLWPAHSHEPNSGCHDYVSRPCEKAYYAWDDKQTQATTDSELICTLGTASNEKMLIAPRSHPSDDSASFSREWLMGKWSSKAYAK